MSDRLAAEHPRLLESASALLTHLISAGSHLRIEGGVSHMQHGQFAERLASLHLYLCGALALVSHDLYMPAFAVLRSALEHHVQDHLLFLGNRFTALIKEVSEETLNEWTKGMEEGREESLSFWRSDASKGTRSSWSGQVHTSPERTRVRTPEAFSIYYPVIFDNCAAFTEKLVVVLTATGPCPFTPSSRDVYVLGSMRGFGASGLAFAPPCGGHYKLKGQVSFRGRVLDRATAAFTVAH
jgi:hypothetical protein